MTYDIVLKNCRFWGYHGVLEEERSLGQTYELDVAMSVADKGAVEADDFAGTVDYGEVFSEVEAIVTGTPLRMIETLAHRVGSEVLWKHPLVQDVAVTVRKPSAPVPGILDHVEVTVRVTR